MIVVPERSAGVIPYRLAQDGALEYLVLHSALVRNPRAKWEFPKGTVENGESLLETAVRELNEETGIVSYAVREGFDRTLSYTYIRKGRKILKTVTYFAVHVLDDPTLVRSLEHVEDLFGFWYFWGSFKQIHRLLYHAKIRQVFVEADAFIRGEPVSWTPEELETP